MSDEVCLLTPTWSGDRVHFDLMRTSVENSPLADLTHHVVVQTEDIDAFRPYRRGNVELVATADVLPAEVEAMRRRARHMQAAFGRQVTRVAGSLARNTGFPRWVRYTGWHVQQITKLALATQTGCRNVVSIDSDVIVTPHARASDFLDAERIVCFQRPARPESLHGKVANWNRQAHALLDQPYDANAQADAYFDTPFVFHAPTVRAMQAWLEDHYHRLWWQVLLAQPPRRWSEFGTYRLFLRALQTEQAVDWRSDAHMAFIFDASDPGEVHDRVARLLADAETHYITVHSQSSGRQRWSADDYAPLLRTLLQ